MKTTFNRSFSLVRQWGKKASSLATLCLVLLLTGQINEVSAQCFGDKEEPTIVCRTLRTTFMPDTCMVVIWAREMLTSASDDLTPADQLMISFDSAGTQNSLALFGVDGMTQTVKVYVTDLCGKQTWCYADVVVNDNDGLCIPKVFDLALRKTVSASTPGPYVAGSAVTFDIEVVNQGNQDAYRIELTDYIPEGLILNDANWTLTGNEAIFSNAIEFLAAGESATVTISFTIDENFTGTSITNLSEISYADDDTDPDNEDPVDEDSTPDDEDENDGEPVDDAINDPDDEDDHDPAVITIDEFDLAIKKTAITDGSVNPGESADFRIVVYNQGTLPATNVVLKDFVPTYMTNNDPEWLGDTIVVPMIAAGDSAVLSITLDINADYQGFEAINNVEIIGYDEPYKDEDSDIDTEDCVAGVIGSNESNDDVDDEAPGTPGTEDNANDADECDHAVIEIKQVFDLALVKKVKEDKSYQAGDLVTFVITVYNQGSLDATNVVVSDIPPTQMVIEDTDWTNGTITINEIAAGDSANVEVDLRIMAGYMGRSLINSAEVISADNAGDIDDEDSSLDTVKCLVGQIAIGEIDNEIRDDSNGSSDIAADADECDYAEITVEQRFDLALRKRVQGSTTYAPGDTVTFLIDVHNQGTLDATNIVVQDIASVNTTIVDSDWTNGKFTIAALAAGDSTTISIDVRINPDFQGSSIINNAEIEGEDDDSEEPIDCVADSTNNQIDDDLNDDVDECDYAVVDVEQTFDLAVRKRVVDNRVFAPGDTVNYTVEVFNQGTLDATEVVIRDYVPTGMTNISAAWSGDSIVLSSLAAGESRTLEITMVIDASFREDTIINNVEIVDATNALDQVDEDDDLADIDCEKDVIGSGEVDDDISDDSNGGTDTPSDADDCDFAIVEVDQTFDLALRKIVMPSSTFSPGDTVTYMITVYNQGSVNASNIVVRDIISEHMTFADASWTGGEFVVSTLDAGEDTSIMLLTMIDADFLGDSIINNAEIVSADNELGLTEEQDSDLGTVDCVADEIGTGETDNDIDDEASGTPGTADNPNDADECDYAVIPVKQPFDLALRKLVAEDGPFVPGDTVTFEIQVHNQTDRTANNIVVRDIPSVNTTIVDSDWTNGTFTIATLTGNDSVSIFIDVMINEDFQGTSIINNAEIEGEDDDSEDPIDCVADSTNGQTDNDLNDDVDECDYAEIDVEQEFDLALRKQTVSSGPFEAGDTVEYRVTVYNQGTLDATDVKVKDFISQHMSPVSGLAADSTITIASIPAGESVTRTFRLRISTSFTGVTIINTAEIIEATNALSQVDEDDDISVINCGPDDTFGEADDDIDDEASGTPGTADNPEDIDDCDYAVIPVGQSLDLAVRKVVSGSTTTFEAGDTVTYDIWVINQGRIDATDIELTDFVSANMTNVDQANWPNNIHTIDSLSAGDSVMVTISLRINEDFQGNSIINNVEVTDFTNEFNLPDEDSNDATECVADEIATGEVDNDVRDDSNGNTDNPNDADECDHAVISVDQEFDLAIQKTVDRGPYRAGDTVTYTITVYNQGTLDATGIVLSDLVSDSMIIADANWTGNTRNIGSLAAGANTTVTIDLQIHPEFSGDSLINNVEITAGTNALGEEDDDSGDLSVLDCTNDEIATGEIDDEINDDPDNADDADECDHAVIDVTDEDVCVEVLNDWCGWSVVTCSGGPATGEFVAAIINTSNTKSAPRGNDWADPFGTTEPAVEMIRPRTWTLDDMGQIFGTSVSQMSGDIYFAASNVYAYDGDPFTPSGKGPGGEQGIYKANYNSPGTLTSLVTTSNTYIANPVGGSEIPGKLLQLNGNNSLPTGWGNIAYDEVTNMIYASNLSDGRIYVIEDLGSTGIVRQAYDPFPSVSGGFLPAPFPANQVVWGLEINQCTRELYFIQQTVAGGGNNLPDNGPVRVKKLFSLPINGDGTLDTGSQALVVDIAQGTREKITDIDINSACDRIVLAERGRVHNSMTLLYERTSTGWQLVTDITVGGVENNFTRNRGFNSTGGVSFGADMVGAGMNSTCDTVVWTMGDCLDPTLVPNDSRFGQDCNVYGPQGVFLDEDNIAALSGNLNSTGIFINLTPNSPFDPRVTKFGIGDIEVFNCCCPEPSASARMLVGEIAGNVQSASALAVEEVEVDVQGATLQAKEMTTKVGEYHFSTLPMHDDYTITPKKVDNPLAGVSALDMIHIQNHILGIKAIDNAYDLIAADVNGDSKINAKDLVTLRRLLLGTADASPTADAWRFVSEMTFDADYPFDYEQSYTFYDFENTYMHTDFTAVKVGDVNRSLDAAEVRSGAATLRAQINEAQNRVDFYLPAGAEISGLQLALELPYGTVITDVTSESLDMMFFAVDEQVVSIVSITDGIEQSDAPLFSIKIDAAQQISENDIRLSDARLNSEIYGTDLSPVALSLDADKVEQATWMGHNVPNPFSRATEIEFQLAKAQDVRFEFYSMDGQLLHAIKGSYDAGHNVISVSKADLGTSAGTIIYQMVTDTHTLTKKMIMIE